MKDTRVLRRRIGSMPMRAEIALANALQARRLRLAASGAPGHPNSLILAVHAEKARRNAQEYRANRTWVYGGEPHVYNNNVEGTG
ncbi:MAG: hypothetical protein JRC86_00585 [Deltaproteobacteria bacterium]|nr:hypothetical protein [Deltaproteobacteria bacterium]